MQISRPWYRLFYFIYIWTLFFLVLRKMCPSSQFLNFKLHPSDIFVCKCPFLDLPLLSNSISWCDKENCFVIYYNYGNFNNSNNKSNSWEREREREREREKYPFVHSNAFIKFIRLTLMYQHLSLIHLNVNSKRKKVNMFKCP